MASPSADIADLPDGDLARCVTGAGAEPATIAEAELCRRFRHRLELFGRRHLRDAELARDLVQDTLVLVIEKLRAGEVRDPDRIGGFILGVARQLSRSRRRERTRHQPLDEAVQLALAAPAPTADPLAREPVARCLEGLPDRQRAVLILTFYAEEGTARIAASLGLTPNNVRVTRHRGLARMRGCLGLEDPAA